MNGWAVNFRVEEKSTEGIATGQQQIALLFFGETLAGNFGKEVPGFNLGGPQLPKLNPGTG